MTCWCGHCIRCWVNCNGKCSWCTRTWCATYSCPGYGYLAIAALICGNWDIRRTLLTCLIFGFARSGGYQLILKLGMSSDVSDLLLMIPYVLTLLLLLFFSREAFLVVMERLRQD